jgi:hypothetical protein
VTRHERPAFALNQFTDRVTEQVSTNDTNVSEKRRHGPFRGDPRADAYVLCLRMVPAPSLGGTDHFHRG